MQEVLDEIVQLLTEERFMNKMVVILAGYEAQVSHSVKNTLAFFLVQPLASLRSSLSDF